MQVGDDSDLSILIISCRIAGGHSGSQASGQQIKSTPGWYSLVDRPSLFRRGVCVQSNYIQAGDDSDLGIFFNNPLPAASQEAFWVESLIGVKDWSCGWELISQADAPVFPRS